MKKFYTLLLSLFLINSGISQVANDICNGAINLGTLPAPPPCVGSFGGGSASTFTYNGTTVNAVAENPYSSLACMDAPAADVWVSFVATGNELEIDFSSGLGDANIGIYSGGCNSLTGLFCEASNNGNISTTLTPFIPGETYYMQISGQDPSDFDNFTLELTSINNCNLCLLAAGITANPTPINGFYLPGTTVEFCMEVTEFEQIGLNWLSGVVPNLGPMWDASTLTGVSSPNAGNPYEWVWDNGPFGLGWYVDYDPPGGGPGGGPDGDYTNNYGDPAIDGSGSWTFCFEVTASSTCTAGGDLGLIVQTYSDFETGGYGTPGCVGDPDVPFTAYMLCCDVPITSFIPVSCYGYSDGSATAQGQGGVAPYDYTWLDPSGSTIYTDNNNSGVSSLSGLAAGIYTVKVVDDNGCEQLIDITITEPPIFTVTASSTASLCDGTPCSGTLSSNNTGGSGNISYSWNGGVGSGQNQTNICAGSYTVSATDANGCIATDVTTVNAPPPIVITASGTDEICDGACDGALTSSATGGTSPYSYS